jgi:PDDEXK-like uncharacterized protein DUF3799
MKRLSPQKLAGRRQQQEDYGSEQVGIIEKAIGDVPEEWVEVPNPETPFGDYDAAPGLSHSGMKDLAVSPLRYWFLHVNPDRPVVEPSRWMKIGTAVHCATFEPKEFDKRFACEVIPPDGCLETMDDLRGWIRDQGHQPRGTRKAEVIAQVQVISSEVPILDVLRERHATEHAGKEIYSAEDWALIKGSAEALANEPEVQRILKVGISEVALFATDPDTGVPLKSRIDWLHPELTFDLKTFSQQRGKSIDRSVADAIWYEGYFRQAFMYNYVRSLQPGEPKYRDFVIAFVESEPPHEIRIKVLRPKTGTEPNLYWIQAQLECRSLIRLYADCLERFGDKPWRTEAKADPLLDEDMKALSYS